MKNIITEHFDQSSKTINSLKIHNKKILKKETGKTFPSNPLEQLKLSIEAVFNSWNNEGKQDTFSMNRGECWFLDTRRPHTAVNNGDDIRIHLVVDVFANDEIRRLVT